MQPDELFLVPFFEQPQPGTLALQAVVAAFQFQHRGYARKGVGHDGNDGAVAEPFDIGLDPDAPAAFPREPNLPRHRDGIKQLAHLVRLKNHPSGRKTWVRFCTTDWLH